MSAMLSKGPEDSLLSYLQPCQDYHAHHVHRPSTILFLFALKGIESLQSWIVSRITRVPCLNPPFLMTDIESGGGGTWNTSYRASRSVQSWSYQAIGRLLSLHFCMAEPPASDMGFLHTGLLLPGKHGWLLVERTAFLKASVTQFCAR